MILQILRYCRAQKKEASKTSLCVIRLGVEPIKSKILNINYLYYPPFWRVFNSYLI